MNSATTKKAPTARQSARKLSVTHWRRWLLSAVVAGTMALAVFVAMLLLSPKGQAINVSGYQAVFLLNDQVYFGKLVIAGEHYILKDPYVIQDLPVDKEATKDTKQTAPNFSLQKVSNTVYGPTASMDINRDQVLFWQNLADTSKVATAIKRGR